MTRTANARIAGCTFLAYIAAGISSMMLSARAMAGETIAARLDSLAANAGAVGPLVLLAFAQCFAAIILGVTLHGITREEDPDLAMLGLASRVGEGVLGALSIATSRTLLWLATAPAGGVPDPESARALAAFLMRSDMPVTATFFAVGSAAFSWLLLRGRMIPVALAWIGLVASALLVVALPLQFAGYIRGPVTQVIWLPMLAFEVPVALWLIVKGVASRTA